MRRAAGVLLALLAAARPGAACDSASCALVTRGQAGLLAPGRLRVDLSFRYTENTQRLSGRDPVAEVRKPKLYLEQGFLISGFHSEYGGHESFVQADLAYGLGRTTTVYASVPVRAHRSFDIGHVRNLRQDYETTGLGDSVLGVRQALPFGALVGGLALKVPTGRNDVAGDFDGSVLDPMLQPGSGSWDVVLAAQYSGRLRGLDWTANGSWQVTGTNQYDYRFGNEVIGALSVSRRLKGRLGGSLQAKLFHKGRSLFRDEGVPSTGTTLVYLSSGLSLALPGGLSTYGVWQYPLHREVNETQLAPVGAVLTGFSKTF